MKTIRAATLLTLLVVVQSFDLPSIGDVFNNLRGKTKKVDVKEEELRRVKRQDPGIGDESQLPHEVRSST